MARLSLLIVLLLAVYRCTASCDSGWVTSGDYCYKHFTSRKTWDAAQASCETNGGSVVSIASKEEQLFLTQNFGTRKFWIGYVLDPFQGHFRWSDFSERSFQSWHSGEPNNLDDETCAVTGGSKYKETWNNVECDEDFYYVCKKPALEATDYPEFWRKQAYETLHKALDDAKLNENIADNVIMFLGDGMSIPTVVATRIMKGQNAGNLGEETVLTYEAFPHIGLSKTYNTDFQVPDSAGTATAYLTGVKTKKGVIGLDARALPRDCDSAQGREVSSILKVAKEAGMAVGFVTTTRITHASPSGLYAHVPYRHWEHETDGTQCDDIAKQFVRSEVDIDVTFGGGWQEFRPTSYSDGSNAGAREDSLDLIKEWQERYNTKGAAKYITKLDELNNLDVAGTDYVLGLFNPDHIDYEAENVAGQPTLSEMTEMAIRMLSKNGRRYFLFVEGGRIDHAHHVNIANLALTESLALERAVEMSMQQTKGTNTLTIVTSDHSHTMTIAGYPVRGHPILGVNNHLPGLIFDDGVPFTTLNYAVGPGAFAFQKSLADNKARSDPSKQDTKATKYMQSALIAAVPAAHAGDDVAIFAHGPMSHLFHSVHEQNYIMHVMQYAACIGDFAPKCH